MEFFSLATSIRNCTKEQWFTVYALTYVRTSSIVLHNCEFTIIHLLVSVPYAINLLDMELGSVNAVTGATQTTPSKHKVANAL